MKRQIDLDARVAKIRVGDTVKVTISHPDKSECTAKVKGKVWEDYVKCLRIGTQILRDFNGVPGEFITSVDKHTPAKVVNNMPEPLDPAVRIIDKDGDVWARIGDEWVTAEAYYGYVWDDLVKDHGPLSLKDGE